jgi:hypothetical protein
MCTGKEQETRSMDENLRAQIETYLSHLNGLIQQGHQLRDKLATDPTNQTSMAAAREWHEHCGVTINQLSGGSKAHWLARSFSEAFLMRTTDGRATEGAAPAEIIKRQLGVLDQAVASLSGMGDVTGSGGGVAAASAATPAPRRFEFVHNAELRPVIEQAYIDSRRALDEKDFNFSLRTSCGILEAIVTDALEHAEPSTLAASITPAGKIGDWPFETRLAVAERAGLIRGGCARLPAVARKYRDDDNVDGQNGQNVAISERDARTTSQVLHVVMRDLNPSR